MGEGKGGGQKRTAEGRRGVGNVGRREGKNWGQFIYCCSHLSNGVSFENAFTYFQRVAGATGLTGVAVRWPVVLAPSLKPALAPTQHRRMEAATAQVLLKTHKHARMVTALQVSPKERWRGKAGMRGKRKETEWRRNELRIILSVILTSENIFCSLYLQLLMVAGVTGLTGVAVR